LKALQNQSLSSAYETNQIQWEWILQPNRSWVPYWFLVSKFDTIRRSMYVSSIWLSCVWPRKSNGPAY